MMLNPEKSFYFIESTDTSNPDLAMYSPGWYFIDADEQFEGPYQTLESCKEGLQGYITWCALIHLMRST